MCRAVVWCQVGLVENGTVIDEGQPDTVFVQLMPKGIVGEFFSKGTGCVGDDGADGGADGKLDQPG